MTVSYRRKNQSILPKHLNPTVTFQQVNQQWSLQKERKKKPKADTNKSKILLALKGTLSLGESRSIQKSLVILD